VSEQPPTVGFSELERINAQLTASLKSCRTILRDCQQKLAANSNDPGEPAGGGKDEDAELA
jgi:hypothetical protein